MIKAGSRLENNNNYHDDKNNNDNITTITTKTTTKTTTATKAGSRLSALAISFYDNLSSKSRKSLVDVYRRSDNNNKDINNNNKADVRIF